jgi:hypothetical protein
MKEITLKIRVDLDDVELAQRAQELGLTTLRIDEVEDAKASVNKEFKEELTGLRERARDLSRVLNSRSEVRPLDCIVEFHVPAQGTKRIARKDTGDFLRDEPMTLQECQDHLFDR